MGELVTPTVEAITSPAPHLNSPPLFSSLLFILARISLSVSESSVLLLFSRPRTRGGDGIQPRARQFTQLLCLSFFRRRTSRSCSGKMSVGSRSKEQIPGL